MNAAPQLDRVPIIALVGNPNCGKTALFNLLTGSHQKVANYAGVTVERKEGTFETASGKRLRLLDLPGVYGLEAQTLDERVMVDALLGRIPGEQRPDLVVCVADATNLRMNLRLVLAVRRLGVPMILALNMSDLAARRGLKIDTKTLARELHLPVVSTVGLKRSGISELLRELEAFRFENASQANDTVLGAPQLDLDHTEVTRLLKVIGAERESSDSATDRIDRIVLHPIAGPLILLATLFLVFQAVFAWAQPLMDGIEIGVGVIGETLNSLLPAGLFRSLLVDGIIAGVGSVLVFLPQILILFFFIIVLEESGYLPRAAFLLDRIMGSVGLSGRAFIPLLSSFACAIPGIMATRTIPDARDRLTTIMIAPLMTCSARLPVYALLIGAFIAPREVWGIFELQGLVLFALYVAGVASAMAVAFVLKRTVNRLHAQPLMMELPTYHWPALRNLIIGLWQRAQVFLVRVGTIILTLMVLLWALSSFPTPPPDFQGPAIEYSVAGRIGSVLAVIFEPIGFNWQISIALVPGLAAREVAVGALGTVYALSSTDGDPTASLTPIIASTWGLPTALSLLAWYVFAPQCLATLAAVKRETNSWRYPLLMAAYLFALAYLASWVTYRTALALS
ncbi:MAG: ferrous iron transporter B [Candidatus Obscuribacterales bacterium]|nr:ferrous iron transporter B [Steroidobacteraceae bacterium]